MPLTVIYRITSIPSTNPSPIYQDNKNKLNEICLKSFVNAFSDLGPKVIFLADYCSCLDMIDQVCTFEHEIKRSMSGINQTMLDTYNIASGLEGNVLFQECDYLYQDKPTGILFNEAIKHFGLVSPYDHPDFYFRYDIHPKQTEMEVFENTHFRKSQRNTMTWGTTADIVRENKALLDHEGYLDGPVWDGLRNAGHQLWTPVPGFATHMVAQSLAPGVNWEGIWLNS